MRIGVAIGAVCAGILLAGCQHSDPVPFQNKTVKLPVQPAPQPSSPPKTYVTPHLGTSGRVEMVNNAGRFVVLSFPLGKVPPAGQHWSIQHEGLRVGRVTISGPQRDLDTVADIVEGQAYVGDEAVPE